MNKSADSRSPYSLESPVNRSRTALAAGLLAVVALATTACGSSSGASSASDKAATAKSAADLGGMDALVAAAKKEGALNVITLPRTWAGYGDLMDNFTKKYGIKITDANPDGSSQDEINAVKQLKGQDRAPDVLDRAPPSRCRRPAPTCLRLTRSPPGRTSRTRRRTRRAAGTTTTAATSPSATTASA